MDKLVPENFESVFERRSEIRLVIVRVEVKVLRQLLGIMNPRICYMSSGDSMKYAREALGLECMAGDGEYVYSKDDVIFVVRKPYVYMVVATE